MPLELIGVDHRDENVGERIDQALEEDDLVLVEGLHPEDEGELLYGTSLIDEGTELEESEIETENDAVHRTVNEGNVVYLDEGLEGFADTTEDLTIEYMSAIESIKEADKSEELGEEDLFYLISMSVSDDTSYDAYFGEPERSPGKQVEEYLRGVYEQKGKEMDEEDERELEETSERIDDEYSWEYFKDKSAELFLHKPELQEREEYWKRKIDIAAEEYDDDDLTIVVGSLHAMETEGNLREKLEAEYEINAAPITSYIESQ
ncbi:hypothetical protein [Candidatus Nanohalococcus occultus]|uniref:hypothetical protein n=1 Tax=Candidatus Nanohalococcus occultus TaxID=2978047 RepID=UPI0039E0B1C5